MQKKTMAKTTEEKTTQEKQRRKKKPTRNDSRRTNQVNLHTGASTTAQPCELIKKKTKKNSILSINTNVSTTNEQLLFLSDSKFSVDELGHFNPNTLLPDWQRKRLKFYSVSPVKSLRNVIKFRG